MHCPDATLVKPPKASRRIFALAVAVLGLVYFVVGQDFRKSPRRLRPFLGGDGIFRRKRQRGSATGIASIGVLGSTFFSTRKGVP